jgi:hypothetical protein
MGARVLIQHSIACKVSVHLSGLITCGAQIPAVQSPGYRFHRHVTRRAQGISGKFACTAVQLGARAVACDQTVMPFDQGVRDVLPREAILVIPVRGTACRQSTADRLDIIDLGSVVCYAHARQREPSFPRIVGAPYRAHEPSIEAALSSGGVAGVERRLHRTGKQPARDLAGRACESVNCDVNCEMSRRYTVHYLLACPHAGDRDVVPADA